jgi:rare lipoprotein A
VNLRALIVGAVAIASILALAAFLLCGQAMARECLKASWYGTESGSRTADGSFFDGTQMIVAHRTLPFGTKLHLTNKANGRVAVATVRDRGPAEWTGRDLDLSRAVAQKLGMIRAGVGTVCIQRIN